MGILLRIPHLPLGWPASGLALLPLLGPPCCWPGSCWEARFGRRGWGTSKMCRVDLSEVQAIMVPDGLNARENMVAVSMPRRSSAMRAQLLVEKMRMRVPYL